MRYLLPALALTCAAGPAIAELRGAPDRWVTGIGLVFALQAMLGLHAEMPTSVRLLFALLDVVLVLLAVLPRLRSATTQRPLAIATSLGLLALAGAPWLARYRVADRTRALESEFTVHATGARFFARAWGWLADHGVTGTVAAVGEPGSYFVYPAMGTHLERRLRYVNINRADHPLGHSYPNCDPRREQDVDAWLGNLAKQDVGWVYLNRYPDFPFPVEDAWATARPTRFALRYEDELNRIYEVLGDPSALPAR